MLRRLRDTPLTRPYAGRHGSRATLYQRGPAAHGFTPLAQGVGLATIGSPEGPQGHFVKTSTT